MKKFTLLLLIFSSLYCSRFKVTKLEPERVFAIPIGEEPESLDFPRHHGIYHGIPSRIGISGDWLIVSETRKKRIKIFKGENLSVVIHNENVVVDENEFAAVGNENSVEVISSSNLDIPGMIIAGNNDDFYVLNYSPAERDQQDEEGIGFYKIIQYDVKGNMLDLIGREGKEELPFESISWMDIDSENNLWVLHRHLGELQLDRYSDGENIVSLSQKDCERVLFADQIENSTGNTLSGCELMYPVENGEEILMVGKVEKISNKKSDKSNYAFLYRKFVLFNYTSTAKSVVFEKLNDPEDYPYIPNGNNLFIWRTLDPSKIRLGIYTSEGDITKSLQVELFGKRPNWRSLYATLSGNIIGIRVFNRTFEVYEWH
ncbi:MAG: hypothetical protein ABUK01_03685 [Leptospirales bacterium]